MADSAQSTPKLKPKLAFKCPFCFKVFADGSAFIKHLASHNLVERKENDRKNTSSEASLPQCYVRLTRCDNLVNKQCSVKPEIPTGPKKPSKYVKILTRKGEALLRCTECPKTFRYRNKANEHFRCHTGERPYRCTFCDSAFTRSETLKKHIRTHTGEKPYQCATCNRAFAQITNLKAHERNHTGEKPYSCQFCSASFTVSNNMKRHIRIHEGIKPFKCLYCTFKCVRTDGLKKHYMRFHKLTNLKVINSKFYCK